MLPDGLRAQAQQRASEEGISFGELVRRSLYEKILREPSEIREDPLFRDDEVYTGSTPSDLATDHDRYLYGEEP